MPLHLTGRHMTITEETKDYIDKKLDRLRRVCGKIDELSFILTKEKLYIEVEGLLRAGKLTATAKERAPHTNEAVDMLVDKLEMQISRAKDRRSDRSPASREKAQLKALSAEEVLQGAREDIEPEG